MAGKLHEIQVGTIVYNEAHRLPVWLEHWKALAKRVIVIDQGSDDGTQDILRESGVDWFERLPHGNPDIHWNDLISMAHNAVPMFRIGVDEFIEPDTLVKMLTVMKAHPSIVMWWLSRRNWINGNDVAEHPEVIAKASLLLEDWQPIISIGKPYTYCGRVHSWPTIHAPSQVIGFMDESLKLEHRRTLDDVECANESRRHICRTDGGNQQDWFLKIAQETSAGRGE